ncbi:MAG: SAM-dependent methyltransferase [Acidimicrobiales bacterium]|jgi:SAM-dependent methyltransferase
MQRCQAPLHFVVPCDRDCCLNGDVTSQNKWLARIEEDPNHSSWYIERFRTMAAEGRDLAGEARFIDALAARESHILDAGCGPGRVGAALAAAGHTVVGVDIDPALIDAARAEHPGPTWFTADLSELELGAHGVEQPFDLIVCAGNVMTFLADDTRIAVLERMAAHLAADGRAVIGFGANRGYEFDEFGSDVAAAGLHLEIELGTWDMRPFQVDSDFLVAILTH